MFYDTITLKSIIREKTTIVISFVIYYKPSVSKLSEINLFKHWVYAGIDL